MLPLSSKKIPTNRNWDEIHENFNEGHGGSKFCPQCGMLLPYLSGQAQCGMCEYVSDGATVRSVVTSVRNRDIRKNVSNQKIETRSVIKETCPMCLHSRLFFWTMQLRSADEGQTCFFECEKCRHTFSQNT